MTRDWFGLREELPRFWLKDGYCVIGASKCPHRVKRFKEIDNDEFDFVPSTLAEYVSTMIAFNTF